MATLQVDRKTRLTEVRVVGARLDSYDERPVGEIPRPFVNARGVLPVRTIPSARATLVVSLTAARVKQLDWIKPAYAPAFPVSNDRSAVRSWTRIPCYDLVLTDMVAPMNDAPMFIDSEEGARATDVDLNIGVTFDSAFNFEIKSNDGIRAVLGDDGQVIPSGATGYSVDDLVIGDNTHRSVITHSNLKINLTVKPTIVKRS